MKLNSERKIKFWLSVLVKVLIVVLIAFKLSPYLINKKSDTDTQKESAETSSIDSSNVESEPFKQHSNTEEQENEKVDEKVKPVKEIVSSDNYVNTILNPSVKNKDGIKDMAVFVFGESAELNNKINIQLQDEVFADYSTTGILVLPNKLTTNIKENLIAGNISVLGSEINAHTDYICVASAKHTFGNSKMGSEEVIICYLELNLSTYTATGERIKNLSKFSTYKGQGLKTHQEALNNAIKKIKLY